MSEIPKLVVWLDPGLTTGWASLYGGQSFESGQGSFTEVGDMLDAHGNLYQEDLAIGWEQYIVTPGGGIAGTANPPIEVIGMAKWIGYWHNATTLTPVPSSFRLPASTQMLKKLGWYRPGQEHANQAARHLLAWMFREKLLTVKQHLALFVD